MCADIQYNSTRTPPQRCSDLLFTPTPAGKGTGATKKLSPSRLHSHQKSVVSITGGQICPPQAPGLV